MSKLLVKSFFLIFRDVEFLEFLEEKSASVTVFKTSSTIMIYASSVTESLTSF